MFFRNTDGTFGLKCRLCLNGEKRYIGERFASLHELVDAWKDHAGSEHHQTHVTNGTRDIHPNDIAKNARRREVGLTALP
jgi:hypothetical protein